VAVVAATVRVEPAGIELAVEEGETVMRAAERLGYRWPTVCHGQAVCTTCFLEVLAGSEHLVAAAPRERSALASSPLVEAGGGGLVRLACQVQVTGDVVVGKRGVRPMSECG
jgi:ferredoxin, 2Fe-2S